MCVLYVSLGSKVRPRTFGCVDMRSAVLFIFRSRLLLYSTGSGLNRVQVFFSWILCEIVLFCPGKNFMQIWLYVFLGCTHACMCRCDGDVICVDHDLNWCSCRGMSAVYMLNSVGERTPPCGTPVLN